MSPSDIIGRELFLDPLEIFQNLLATEAVWILENTSRVQLLHAVFSVQLQFLTA